jgi:hypothetical protein
MNSGRLTPSRRSLALAVAVLAGFFLLAAGRAQAHEWKIGGATFSKLGIKEQPFSLSGVPIKFVWPFSGVAFRFSCSMSSEKGVLTPEGKGSMTLKFPTCASEEPIACKFAQVPGTGAVKFELVESGSVLYEKITPASGGKLFEFTTTGCAIGASIPFEGSFAGKAKTLFEEKVEQPWETNAEINSAAGAKLSAAGGAITPSVSGSGVEELTGAKEGSLWSSS